MSLRTAVRALAASRGFTATAVGTLGIGLALAITIVAVLNAYLIRALPYPAADRLYRLDYAAPGQNWPENLDRLEWRGVGETVEHLISWDLDVFYMLGSSGEYTHRASGAWVTPGYLRGLGIRTDAGRVFDDRDYVTGAPSVALISHALWQSRFRGDPDVVGRTFRAYVSDRPEDAEIFTVVGVLARDLWHVNAYSDVLTPLRAPSYPYQVRLRPGVSREAAVDRLTAFVRAGNPTLPADWRMRVTSLQESYVGPVRPMLVAVATAAALVLLIAATNVAVLLLVRGRRRENDLAVRMALGASPGQLVQLLVVEGLVLGAAATAVGVGVSALVVGSLGPAVEAFLGRRVPGGTDAVAIDGTVLAIGLACGLLLALLFTLVPLLSLRPARLFSSLARARGTTDSRAMQRARSVLIAVEVAGSIALLAGAALMLQSALGMLRVDFGFDAHRVVTAGVGLRLRSYPDAASQAVFYERFSAQFASTNGGASIELGNWWPLEPARPSRLRADAATTEASASVIRITGGYFSTLGFSLVDGRTFSARDAVGSEPVVIVSAALAKRMWPGARAVGQGLTITGNAAGDTERRRLVVGVVNDIRQTHADTDHLDAYVPFLQEPNRFAFIYVRDPRPSWEDDLRAAAAAVDPEVAVGTPRSLEASLELERGRPRFLATLLAVFAAAASVLALVGVHGVIAYAVRQRQREIAIRMAVGADAAAVTRLFLRQGAIVLAGGIAAGLWGAAALGRVLESYLHDVTPADPGVLAAASLAFAAVGLIAVWWPARRAAATDAALVLKAE